ncbi:MAG: sigma-70 family RNA polymerase sigma factor [Nitrospinae bacterium]|nr:sigma-70 family RNA polymerase sigma factor [Nitrospinota bacterium]
MFSPEELNRFYQYCFALTGDETEAYDLLQDSLVKFLGRENNVRSSGAYFRRIIRNHFIDHLRKEGKYEMTELDENVISADENKLENIIINKEETRIILNKLGGNDRELLYLWAVEEYTSKELAEFLKVPRGTILSRLHRLKIKINNFLDEENEKNSKRKYPRTLPKV